MAKAGSTPHSGPDRPFNRTILKRARQIASRYHITVTEEDGVFYGEVVEIPNTFGDGATAEECGRSTRAGAVLVVASMLEEGVIPPA